MDKVSKEKRSEIMSKIHQPTKLEKRVHDWLCGAHIRHKMYPKIAGNPDIRITRGPCVFVDGCFWHCCPIHYRRPKSRQEFWIPHVEGSNLRRESRRKNLPYRWIRVWGHDVRSGAFKGIIKRSL
ncbi:hypothetical protein ES703_125513 [subsurface metagenome]